MLWLLAYRVLSGTPDKPSTGSSRGFPPPHSDTKHSSACVLIARLFVRRNTDAIGGKTSSLIVVKSKVCMIAGKHLRAASVRAWLCDSKPERTNGITSDKKSKMLVFLLRGK